MGGALRHGLFAFNESVPHANDALAMAGNIFLVGHDENGDSPVIIERLKRLQDFFGGGGIEVAGWLVGQEEGRLVDQGPGDGHTLLLAAGHLLRVMVHAVSEADKLEQLLSPDLGFFVAHVTMGVVQGHRDIFQGAVRGSKLKL